MEPTTNKKPARWYRDPIKYKVGVDISEERYNQIIQGIGDWFARSRRTKEPVLLAKQSVQKCLDGVKADGSPWFDAWNMSLAKRLKIMALYDIETMQPLEKASDRRKARKEKEKERLKRKRAGALRDPMIPDEVAAVLTNKNKVKYGDSPHLLLSSEEAKEWRSLHDAYIQQFPELRSINASTELGIVCDLMILAKRYRLKALNNEAVAVEELAKITKELANLKMALGIHPTQLEKRAKPKTDATIAAAVARLESFGNWREIRQRFFYEELLQAYQMSVTPRANGEGYQLNEVSLYALTKCRTCRCHKCGERNAAGFSVDEIEHHLVELGYLEKIGDEPPVQPSATYEDLPGAPD